MNMEIKKRLESFKNKEIPEGYKKVQRFIIPKDWEFTEIKNVATEVSILNKENNDYRVLSCTKHDGLVDSLQYFKKQVFSSDTSKYKIVKKNYLVYATNHIEEGSIGIQNLYDVGLVSPMYTVFKTKDNILPEYLYALLKTENYRRIFETMMSASVNRRGSLRWKEFSKIKVMLPPKKEQQKIVSILSTWDKAIELKEKLIEQKKEQKKGLMQKLLTGEVRLPGFEGEWKEVRLGEIGKTYSGLSGKTAEDFGKGGKPYIPYKTIFDDSKIDLNKIDYVYIGEDEKQNSAKYGDIFFTASSETPDEVGMSSVLLDDVDEIYLNSFCFGYRLNNFDVLIPEFARYLFRSDGFRRKIFSLAQGSTRFNISKNEVMKIKVCIPSVDEQKEIATILFDFDKEIKLLQKEVDVLKEQKKGLMQLLLTGKVRVKV